MAKQENLHENQLLDKRQQSTQELAMLTGWEQTDKEACLSSQRHSFHVAVLGRKFHWADKWANVLKIKKLLRGRVPETHKGPLESRSEN